MLCVLRQEYYITGCTLYQQWSFILTVTDLHKIIYRRWEKKEHIHTRSALTKIARSYELMKRHCLWIFFNSVTQSKNEFYRKINTVYTISKIEFCKESSEAEFICIWEYFQYTILRLQEIYSHLWSVTSSTLTWQRGAKET